MAASERHHRKVDPSSGFTLIFLFLLCIPGIYGRSILNSTQNLVPELPGTSVLDAKAAGSSRKPSPVVQFNSSIAPAPIPLVNEIICESIIVMNFVENFDQIGNCTVIEGHLKIILIDFPEKSYDTLSFPNLREVTDFVLIYCFQAANAQKYLPQSGELEEIGLISLTRIVRGSVYIWRNNLLCYVDTVNWKALTDPEYEDSNSIRDNKPEDQCANQCPANLCSSFFKSRQRDSCWTDQDCQKSLQPVCENGNKLNKSRGSCCHTHCLSGCFGNDRNECLVCRDVHFQGVCHSLANGCPANSFMIHGRRCVNRDVCRKYKVNGVLYKVHEAERTCVAECPPGYTVSKTDPHICNKCNGSCPKVCKGNRKCTELDSALQNIEEIRDYLKVVRSHALLSLSFFKRLRLIRGENLPLGQYALNVIDNQNLQDLWEFTPERPSLQIGRSDAKIGFHFNPQLCRSKIDVFVRKINSTKGIDDYDEHDISKTSNGDRAACDMKALDLRINSFSGHFAQLTWESFNLPDPRSLLGYVVFYRESPAQNLSKFEGRDACGTVNVWTPIDVTPIEGPLQSQILYDLRPATQYGVYITTYTVASEKQSAQSDIQYFTTKSKQPSMPTACGLSRSTPLPSAFTGSLQGPNGVIAFYRIRCRESKTVHRRLAIRDYCNNPIQHRPLFLDGQVTTTPVPILGCNGTDGLGKPVVPQSILDAQKDYEEAIKMENEIQDSSYTQRVRSRRAVREEDSEFFGSMELPVTSFVDVTGGLVNRSTTPSPSWTANTTVAIRINKTTSLGMPTGNSTRLSTTAKTTTTEKPEVIHVREIHEGTSSTIIGLDHFTEYLVSVEACQARSEDINYDPCSGESQAAVTQTLAKRGADDIPSESVKIKYLKQQVGGLQDPIVAVNWTDPEKPNGVIVTVEMELVNLDRSKQVLFF
ncbi:Insulin-like peptide receptor [Hypsibius exemplaris]|uniref:receptor protein-tyrosine kinase n=1 Tax=Hypsibius exemplaris TaxID=2072580 RepID=A0A1W0XDM3_HYPEX|nr:Insulin-like peptide receptor [Hypsibius exemplaris]